MGASYLTTGGPLPYCKGCGHGLVLRALSDALERLRWPANDLVIVTDIGCVGLADAQFVTPHTVHTTHGRSTAFAAGMALADGALAEGRLKPVVMIGDGGATIGLNHLVNAALLNPDVTVLVHNNFLYGMTGGQNSAFTPQEFITATTPAGNFVPPLDLGRLLLASRAGFVARQFASDRELADVIARAVAHPGFALVEILELCTAYATRWNELTGAQLKQVAEKAGYQIGVLREETRPTFGVAYRERLGAAAPRRAVARASPRVSSGVRAQLKQPVGMILAGSAGEHVQSSASLLAQAALAAGLYVTQKNDNPVTQGTGFSLSELILSRTEILFTGIEQPNVVLVVSEEGARELERGDVWSRVDSATLVLADTKLPLPPVAGQVLRFPFREAAGAKLAALAAIVHWLDLTNALPLENLWAALDARFGPEARAIKAKLGAFSHVT